MVKYATRHLHHQRQAISAPQSDNPKQICENILIEGKRYNIEHRILPSTLLPIGCSLAALS
ncbi:hypothetical protein AVMA1855_09490 [Acidovorax sp. SUPP1855]|uniref:hypothetical protein n=1 Tax=Acidovorax sp. SUPP1855 TaxID=431774 RepID=UPI0023DE3DE6|nr:hypothetical protein [Acidovorax sp. SUPP1855]GKS84372.1 hypothetical protein AVMA1855_09490 [Acidovorax sp. SUPP1855]